MSPSLGETPPDDDPYVAQLGRCATLYSELEECLGENKRDLTRCQYLVKALQVCQIQQQAAQRRAEKLQKRCSSA